MLFYTDIYTLCCENFLLFSLCPIILKWGKVWSIFYICAGVLTHSGDEFHQRGVEGEHADHCHLPEGGVFLQGWRFAGSLFRCNNPLNHIKCWTFDLYITQQCSYYGFLCITVWWMHVQPHSDPGPASLPSGWRREWETDRQGVKKSGITCIKLCSTFNFSFWWLVVVMFSVFLSFDELSRKNSYLK